MKYLVNCITVYSIIGLVACSTSPANVANREERNCDCLKLDSRLERGFYLQYLEGEDTLYTGKCSIKRENGNEITYTYLKGHLIADIETYPGGILNEELYYDTTGLITKRVRYYRNGHISYITIFGDHAYEAFYENGSIYRKGMYGMKRGRYGYKDSDFYRNTLFDSIWKENGNFDSVYRYSQASITY